MPYTPAVAGRPERVPALGGDCVPSDQAPGLVVGTGNFVYDVIRPWGTLPADWRLGLVSHVAVDSKDRVYFYQRQDPPVLVFDGDGNFLTDGAASGCATRTASSSARTTTSTCAIGTSTKS